MTSPILLVSYVAVVSDNDGSAFITKAEFDSLKNNFQAQIDNYNQSIDSKIDGAIAAYLAGIKIDTGGSQLVIDWVMDWPDEQVENFLVGKKLHILALNPTNSIYPGRWIYVGGWSSGVISNRIYTPTAFTVNTDTSCTGACSTSATSPLTSPSYLNSISIDKSYIPIMTFKGNYALIEYVGYSGYPQRRYWVTYRYAYDHGGTYLEYSSVFGSDLGANGTSGTFRTYTIQHAGFSGVLGQQWALKYDGLDSSSGVPVDDTRLVWWPILSAEDGSGKIQLKYYICRNATLENEYYQTFGKNSGSLSLSTTKIYFFVKHPDGSTENANTTTNIVKESYTTDQWNVVEVNLRAGDIIGLATTLDVETGNISYYCDLAMNMTNLNP